MKKTPKPASDPAPSAKPRPAPAAKSPPPADNPLDMEGGRRSDIDGKFEADHRPSR